MMLGMAALAALAFYLWWVARLHIRVACPLALPPNIRVHTSYWPCHPAPCMGMLVACVCPAFQDVLAADPSFLPRQPKSI